MRTQSEKLIEKSDIGRLGLGWAAVVLLAAFGSALQPPVSAATVSLALAGIIAIIIACAFGVVKQAEALAHRLSDPYGSLVLTFSIVIIEVILISAVMLGPGDHATIARDSVMAVSMIILNLVVGICVVVRGLRRGGMSFNRNGAVAYLSMIITLVVIAFGIPSLLDQGGSYTSAQAIPIILLTIVSYAFFLWRQMGQDAGDFRELEPAMNVVAANSLEAAGNPRVADDTGSVDGHGSVGGHDSTGGRDSVRDNDTEVVSNDQSILQIISANRREIVKRVLVLVLTVLPIVLLSHDMAVLVDGGLKILGAPAALAGLLIAMIVFLPESITSIRAALGGEAQRVSNLCHGALVSTLALTIPSVLVIGLLTDQTVVLAESPVNLLLLGATLLLSVVTLTSKRMSTVHGVNHLVLFGLYVLVLVGS